MGLDFWFEVTTKPSAESEAPGTGKGPEESGSLGASEKEVEEETITKDGTMLGLRRLWFTWLWRFSTCRQKPRIGAGSNNEHLLSMCEHLHTLRWEG